MLCTERSKIYYTSPQQGTKITKGRTVGQEEFCLIKVTVHITSSPNSNNFKRKQDWASCQLLTTTCVFQHINPHSSILEYLPVHWEAFWKQHGGRLCDFCNPQQEASPFLKRGGWDCCPAFRFICCSSPSPWYQAKQNPTARVEDNSSAGSFNKCPAQICQHLLAFHR